MSCQTQKSHTTPERHYPLDTIDFFAAIPEEWLKGLHNLGRVQKFSKGQVLATQGDPAEFFYMIESGWVKLFRETLDGDEVIIDVLPQGYVFGETSMFEDGQYSYGVEIIENCSLKAYPLNPLKEYVESNPEIALAMLRHLTQKGKMKDREIEHLTVMNAPQRIGCFLLRLCKVKQPAPILLHLPYDKTLIASRLGMQPETFSRALNRIQADTGIKVSGSSVEISDLGKLITYTCIACSNVFPCDD
jgi:CRP-like cAMP-binding protein